MTRQMADDEVLRVLDAAIMRNGHRGDYPGELAMQREARAAVAALQAERDALRDDNARLRTAHDVVDASARRVRERAERAESALEALRGQVAGLVEKWCKPTPQDDCTLYTMGQRTGRTVCAAELNELLAIKERMG